GVRADVQPLHHQPPRRGAGAGPRGRAARQLRPPAAVISVREATDRIVAGVQVLPTEDVPLLEAQGRVLAEAVDSPIDLPPRTTSAMDGYAVRAADVRGASKTSPKRLAIIEELPAGKLWTRAVGAGQCARIFTGAALPDGTDCVIRQEDTERNGGAV